MLGNGGGLGGDRVVKDRKKECEEMKFKKVREL
jgi:hypothetical protein